MISVFSQHVGVKDCFPFLRKQNSQMSVLFIYPYLMPVSFLLLLSQSLPCFKIVLTWGCIGLIISSIFLLILGESLWFNQKNPFHLVKNLIKHPPHPNLILSSLCTPFLICFRLIFQLQNRMYCKENHYFLFCYFIVPRNHKSQSLQSAGNCVSLDPGPLLPSSYT